MATQQKTLELPEPKRRVVRLKHILAGFTLILSIFAGMGFTPNFSHDTGFSIGQSANASTSTDPLGNSSRQRETPSDDSSTPSSSETEDSEEGKVDTGTRNRRETDATKQLRENTPKVNLNNAKHTLFGHFLNWLQRTVMPALVLFLIYALPIQSLLDLIYLLFPIFRQWMADPNEDGQGSNLANAGPSPRKRALFNAQLVSDDAVRLVKQFGGSTQALNQMGGGGRGWGSPSRGGALGGAFGAQSYSQAAQPEMALDDNGSVDIIKAYIKRRILVWILVGIFVTLTIAGTFFDVGFWIGDTVIWWLEKGMNSF